MIQTTPKTKEKMNSGSAPPDAPTPTAEAEYRDFSNEEETANDAREKKEDNFPSKLHFMLSELESDGLSHIVSWQPHGRCFAVHRTDEFVEKILQK